MRLAFLLSWNWEYLADERKRTFEVINNMSSGWDEDTGTEEAEWTLGQKRG
jgi:hypothetical protein